MTRTRMRTRTRSTTATRQTSAFAFSLAAATATAILLLLPAARGFVPSPPLRRLSPLAPAAPGTGQRGIAGVDIAAGGLSGVFVDDDDDGTESTTVAAGTAAASRKRRALLSSLSVAAAAFAGRRPPAAAATDVPSPASEIASAGDGAGAGAKFVRSGDGFAYSVVPPPGFASGKKPLKTHLDEANFSGEVRGYKFGVTVDPVRIDSLRDFGTPEEVAARVVTAEVNRDGIFKVTLARDPVEDGTTGAYVVDYVSDG